MTTAIMTPEDDRKKHRLNSNRTHRHRHRQHSRPTRPSPACWMIADPSSKLKTSIINTQCLNERETPLNAMKMPRSPVIYCRYSSDNQRPENPPDIAERTS